MPLDVLSDKRLTANDVRVYAALAATVWQGKTCTMGLRHIGDMAACAKRKAAASLDNLVRFGYVERPGWEKGSKKRGVYMLKSAIFGQRQGRENVVVAGPRGKRLVSVDRRVG